MNPWDAWDTLRRKETLTVCGIMSGTSADGIDVAVVEFKGGLDDLKHKVVRTGTGAYTEATQALVKQAPNLTAAEVSLLNRVVALEFAQAAQETGLQGVDLIASHGQTVYHHSGQTSVKSSLQVGCGDTLAVELGLPVIHNFRTADVARGGEGAPLTPASDFYLHRHLVGEGGVLVNLGGIANVTVFGSTLAKTRGFDTGPANCVIDRLVRIMTGGKEKYDEDGLRAARGKVDKALLQELIARDLFVLLSPPKSTGFEAYGDTFVDHLLTTCRPPDDNLLATLTAYSAECLAISLRFVPEVRSLVLAGGGAKNDFLVAQIKERTGLPASLLGDFGVPSDSREAIGFALFGYLFARGQAMEMKEITGATSPGILGQLSLS